MDLNHYWRVIRDHWMLFVLAVALTASLAAFFAIRQPDVYEASGTFVVRPRTVDGSEVVRAIDTLNRSVEIGSTFAFIARSDLIEDRARQTLEGDYRGLSVSADLVPGTNVIEISVRGGRPGPVAELAAAVGRETVAYVAGLQDAFELVPLDEAEQPTSPTGPNRNLMIGLGVFLGLGVGVLVALAAHLLRELQTGPSTGQTDPYTGVHSEDYFNSRFSQEVVRAKRRGRPLSLGLMRVMVDHDTHATVPSQSVLRQIGLLMQGKLADEEVLAYLGEGVFGTILVDTEPARAEWQLKQWQKELEAQEFTDAGFAITLRVTVVVGSYGHDASEAEGTEELLSGLA